MSGRFENGFDGRVAVVTGGGTGMGREMVLQLTANGCDVATCDISEENLAETAALCTAAGNKGQLITHIADVSVESDVLAFRDPKEAGLPVPNVNSSFIFAKGDLFLCYPNNYNHFVNYYRNTFQHGGISLEEMIVPVIRMTNK